MSAKESLHQVIRRVFSDNPANVVSRRLRDAGVEGREYPLHDAGTSWGAGGCSTAARAIHSAIGGRLKSVHDSRGDHHHVVVQKGDRFYDADGEHTGEQMLRKLAHPTHVPNPRFSSMPSSSLGAYDHSPETVEHMSGLLKAAIGTGVLGEAGDFHGELQRFAAETKAKHGLEDFDLGHDTRTDTIELQQITVPRGNRKHGVGGAAMSDLGAFADRHGKRVWLQTASKGNETGTTSPARLRRFYGRHGFVRNAGRRKDFALSMYASMYRDPKRSVSESFNVRIDPEKLSLRPSRHSPYHREQDFEIVHDGRVTGGILGRYDGAGSYRIDDIHLSDEFGTHRDENRGALGAKGVMKIGRELRRHGYTKVWSKSRGTGMRGASRFKTAGSNFTVPDTRLPEGMADVLIAQKLREGTVTSIGAARSRPASRSVPGQAQSQAGYEKQVHATMLVHGFISHGAPRDGSPGALYANNHPSRDGRKLLVHSRPDGDWTTWQTINGTGDDTSVRGRGNGHAELVRHLRQWAAS